LGGAELVESEDVLKMLPEIDRVVGHGPRIIGDLGISAVRLGLKKQACDWARVAEQNLDCET
jgi:hypothetical protein